MDVLILDTDEVHVTCWQVLVLHRLVYLNIMWVKFLMLERKCVILPIILLFNTESSPLNFTSSLQFCTTIEVL